MEMTPVSARRLSPVARRRSERMKFVALVLIAASALVLFAMTTGVQFADTTRLSLDQQLVDRGGLTR
jgi:hypothetical protein